MPNSFYEPPKANLADVVDGRLAPPLWNPNAAASWSLLFSPIFGAYLHMKNWQALGEPQKAASARSWLLLALIVTLILPALFFFLPANPLSAVSNVLGFVWLIAWYYGAGKAQAIFVKAHFGNAYPRKSWTRPLLIATVGLLAYTVLLTAAGLRLASEVSNESIETEIT